MTLCQPNGAFLFKDWTCQTLYSATRWERSCSWLKNIMQTNWPCYLYKSHISIQHFINIYGPPPRLRQARLMIFKFIYLNVRCCIHMYIYITKNLYSFSSHSIYIYMTRARIKAILYLQYWIYKFWCAVDERSRRLVQARVCHPQAVVDQKTTCCFFVWQRGAVSFRSTNQYSAREVLKRTKHNYALGYSEICRANTYWCYLFIYRNIHMYTKYIHINFIRYILQKINCLVIQH